MPSLERGPQLSGIRCALPVVAAVLSCAAICGCASASIQRGALIGALSGAAVGAGTGALISNEDLLGSPETAASGDISLDAPQSIAAGAAVGVVFGAIVGAMIGFGDEEAHAPAESTGQAPRARAELVQTAAAGRRLQFVQPPLAPSAF